MNVLRCLVFVFLSLAACDPTHSAQADPAPEAAEAKPEVDNELALIKKHLFNDKDLATGAGWASVLLYREDPAARQLVIEALSHSSNPTARAAVCKALDRSRTDPRQLRDREDFLRPLIGILKTEEDASIARSAAEATLMFSYDQVGSELEKTAGDAQLPSKIRSNAVYALQLHPDKDAALALVRLLDSPDGDVAQAAKNALVSLGISVGDDAESRRRVLDELQKQGPEAYLRKRLVRSEADIRALNSELDTWKRYYLSALRDWYDSIGDEGARNAFLAELLNSPENATKRWALDRLDELKKGTSKPKLSEDVEKALLGLVSSADRQVRLKTARLLALMYELNSAQRLLEQLEVEEDPQVKHELFVALGGACYYASLPTSKLKIADEVRKATLGWAVRFLDEQSVGTARSGADVIRKLLTQDGLGPEEVDSYLEALAQRCRRADSEASDVLRGEFLNAMAGLCDQRSSCRPQATKLYGPLFEQALSDKADAVRQAAVDGLVNIDKAAALKRLRKDFHNDPSAAIQAKLIDLAAEVGESEDLAWLQDRAGTNGGEPAWQAMLKIFGRLNADAMAEWMTRLETPEMRDRFGQEQKMSFLALIEQKAQGENKAELLREVRRRAVFAYAAANNAQQTIQYLQLVTGQAEAGQNQDGIWSELLDACLERSNLALAGEIIENYLLNKDLRQEGPVARSIEGYLNEPPPGVDPNSFRETLDKIEVTNVAGRPKWHELRQHWTIPLAKAKKAKELEKANN